MGAFLFLQRMILVSLCLWCSTISAQQKGNVGVQKAVAVKTAFPPTILVPKQMVNVQSSSVLSQFKVGDKINIRTLTPPSIGNLVIYGNDGTCNCLMVSGDPNYADHIHPEAIFEIAQIKESRFKIKNQGILIHSRKIGDALPWTMTQNAQITLDDPSAEIEFVDGKFLRSPSVDPIKAFWNRKHTQLGLLRTHDVSPDGGTWFNQPASQNIADLFRIELYRSLGKNEYCFDPAPRGPLCKILWDWQWEIERKAKSITTNFSVAGDRECYIYLSSAKELYDGYMIILGQDNNQNIVIKKDDKIVAQKTIPGGVLKSLFTYADFWIDYNNGALSIGRGLTRGVNVLFSFQDKDAREVKTVSLSGLITKEGFSNASSPLYFKNIKVSTTVFVPDPDVLKILDIGNLITIKSSDEQTKQVQYLCIDKEGSWLGFDPKPENENHVFRVVKKEGASFVLKSKSKDMFVYSVPHDRQVQGIRPGTVGYYPFVLALSQDVNPDLCWFTLYGKGFIKAFKKTTPGYFLAKREGKTTWHPWKVRTHAPWRVQSGAAKGMAYGFLVGMAIGAIVDEASPDYDPNTLANASEFTIELYHEPEEQEEEVGPEEQTPGTEGMEGSGEQSLEEPEAVA